jgi:protein-S-isoprenylcysteine O-methyltransferase Ste14
MLSMLYGVVAYAMFVGSFAYAVGFLGNIVVPRSVDSAATTDPATAVAIDLALLLAFALQHSIMARKGFKAWWTRIIPPAIERSTYVAAASLLLFALCWHWQPIAGSVWSVKDPVLVTVIQAVFWLGWGVLFLASWLINHFELFGLRQVYAHLMGSTIPQAEFRTPLLYKHVRHPIYLGFLMGMWASPEMTLGHFLFAAGGTGYILVGVWFEERDLIAHFGERYRAYRDEVPMLLPRLGKRRGGAESKYG